LIDEMDLPDAAPTDIAPAENILFDAAFADTVF
jgi:hypothetical protein